MPVKYFTRAEQAWFLDVFEKIVKATAARHSVKPKKKTKRKFAASSRQEEK